MPIWESTKQSAQKNADRYRKPPGSISALLIELGGHQSILKNTYTGIRTFLFRKTDNIGIRSYR